MSSNIQSSTNNLPVHISSNPTPLQVALKHKLAPSLLAVVLGCAILFAMGFSESPSLHNAAHDGRHSAGFPCH